MWERKLTYNKLSIKSFENKIEDKVYRIRINYNSVMEKNSEKQPNDNEERDCENRKHAAKRENGVKRHYREKEDSRKKMRMKNF